MSVDLIKKPINVFQTIYEQQKEELLETGLIVPDNKLMCWIFLSWISCIAEQETGKVMEVGGGSFTVIYRADNQEQVWNPSMPKPRSISCNYSGKRNIAPWQEQCGAFGVDILNGRKLAQSL